MLCSWEGNRRSDVALTMRDASQTHWYIPTYGLSGLRKGDEQSACAPLEYYGIFTFTCGLIT